jgi:hypothetical protein
VSQRRITCALLTDFRHDWAASIALACPGIDFCALPRSALGRVEAPNPFVLLGNTFYSWLERNHPDRVVETLHALARHADVVVGLDGSSDLTLAFPPHVLPELVAVIKTQGLYRDRDLYNYVVGPVYAGAIWAQKERPRRERYRDGDLERLRLSVPCFMLDVAAIRRAARVRETTAARTIGRKMSPAERHARNVAEAALQRAIDLVRIGVPRRDVHCVIGLTNVQRIEVMRLLEGFSGSRGIMEIAAYIAGAGPSPELRGELAESARPYTVRGVGRACYLLDLARHRVIVAPAGHGELTFRHGEALRVGRALVCQDLSHVEMMLPLRDREEVAFCRPDLSDLRPTVEQLLRDDGQRERIARNGHHAFAAWARDWRRHLHAGVEQPIRDALS